MMKANTESLLQSGKKMKKNKIYTIWDNPKKSIPDLDKLRNDDYKWDRELKKFVKRD